jgi:hypothetical protein
MKSIWVGKITKLPLELKWRYPPIWGNMVKTWYFSSSGHAFTAICVLPTQAPWSRRVSPGIEASRRARIPSPLVEPHQVTRRFCGKLPQTPRVDSGREPLPYTGSCPRLRLAFFLPPCVPHLIPFGHRLHRAKPTCLSTPRRPRKVRLFAPALHLHQRKSSRNLNLQYSAKSQSTPCRQSLITPGSYHPRMLSGVWQGRAWVLMVM